MHLELQILELFEQTPEQQALQAKKKKKLTEPFKEGQALPCTHVCLLYLSFFFPQLIYFYCTSISLSPLNISGHREALKWMSEC